MPPGSGGATFGDVDDDAHHDLDGAGHLAPRVPTDPAEAAWLAAISDPWRGAPRIPPALALRMMTVGIAMENQCILEAQLGVIGSPREALASLTDAEIDRLRVIHRQTRKRAPRTPKPAAR